MKPGDEVWYLSESGVCSGTLLRSGYRGQIVAYNSPYGSLGIEDFVEGKDLFPTEKEALEALISRQTARYAEQTQQHNDLIARLSRRLEDL